MAALNRALHMLCRCLCLGLWPGLLAGLTLGLSACGEPLLDMSYRGASIWQLGAGSGGAISDELAAYPLRAALFYTVDALEQTDAERMVEDTGTTVHIQANIPFVLNQYEKPGAALMARWRGGQSAGMAVGRVLAYADVNGDGRRQSGEPFIGSEPTAVYAYVPAALPADRSPTDSALAEGIHELIVPQLCGYKPLPPTDPGDCGVPLGEGCRSDADCGRGTCLKETNQPWPAGYCTIADTPMQAGACRPSKGVFYRAPAFAPIPEGTQGYYLRPCTTSADCLRAGRDQGYVCDAGLHGCRNMASTKLRLQADNLGLDAFCGGGGTMMMMPPRR